MAALHWSHGTSQDQALAAIREALRHSDYAGAVTWHGPRLEARYGPLASILHARGVVTADAVVLHECRGLAAPAVLRHCRSLLARLFPAGGPA